jgi:hypothetical protein
MKRMAFSPVGIAAIFRARPEGSQAGGAAHAVERATNETLSPAREPG